MLQANVTVENKGPSQLQCRVMAEGHKTLAEKTIGVNNSGSLEFETPERQGEIRLSGGAGGSVRITNTGDKAMKLKSPDDEAIERTIEAQEEHTIKFESQIGKEYTLRVTTQ